MRIKEVEFSFLKNIGNYENQKISYRAELEDWETPEDCIDLLRNRVAEELGLPYVYRDLRAKIREQTDTLNALNVSIEIKQSQLHRAEQAWDNFAEFLTGHGVDPVTLTIENFATNRAKNEYLPPARSDLEELRDMYEIAIADDDEDEDDAYYGEDEDDKDEY